VLLVVLHLGVSGYFIFDNPDRSKVTRLSLQDYRTDRLAYNFFLRSIP
jgi:hypothetical protein